MREKRLILYSALARPPDGLPADLLGLRALLRLLAAFGPSGDLLGRCRTAHLFLDAKAPRDEAVLRLGVRLVLPLGVCVLPAFVLVRVVPVVLGILSSTSGVFG